MEEPSIAITVRPITNGFIVSGQVGVPYGKSMSLGETYYPTLPDVGKATQEIVLDAPVNIRNLLKEMVEDKPVKG